MGRSIPRRVAGLRALLFQSNPVPRCRAEVWHPPPPPLHRVPLCLPACQPCCMTLMCQGKSSSSLPPGSKMPVKHSPAKTPALSASPAPRRDVAGARPTEVSFLRHRHPLGRGSALPDLPGGFVELAERICHVRGGDARPWRAEAPRGVWGGGRGVWPRHPLHLGFGTARPCPRHPKPGTLGSNFGRCLSFPHADPSPGGSEGQAVVVAER